MDIKQKDRSTLKSYFIKNSIPTEANFADLIDSMLNVKDDGLIKPVADPLSIGASGDESSQKKVLNLYRDLSEEQPDWVLSLNPRSQLTEPNSAQRGLGIHNAAGKHCLFIDFTSGRLGVGTNTPTSELAVAGTVRATQSSNENNYTEIGHGGSHGYLNTVGVGRLDFRHDGKNKMVLSDTGRVGIATDDPQDTLDINGKLVFNGKSTRRIYGAKRAGRESLVLTGHWDELEIKGRVIDWTGSNLHIGYDNDHHNDAICIGNYKINRVEIQASGSSISPYLLINRPKKETTGGKKIFLELVQDATSAKVASVYPSIRFQHRNRYWHRFEARDSGFHFKTGDLNKDSYVPIRAKSIQTDGPQVAFTAYLASNKQFGNKEPLPLTTRPKNMGNAYNKDKSEFIAPISGLYLFTMTIFVVSDSGVSWHLKVNNSKTFANEGGNSSAEAGERTMLQAHTKHISASRTCLVQLNKNDKVWIEQRGANDARCDNYKSGWEGVLIS